MPPYNLAKPGTMRLVPPDHIQLALKRDYDEMQAMIYGELPTFGLWLDLYDKRSCEPTVLASKKA